MNAIANRRLVLSRPSSLPIARFGVLIAFLLTIVVFSVLRPDTFATTNNLKDVLTQAAIPAVLALGLTVPLAMADFDLSVGAIAGLSMGICVELMAASGVGWLLAALITIAAGIVVGIANGTLVSYFGLNSFITTLASGSVVAGLEAKITGQDTVYEGIPSTFAALGHNSPLLGLHWPVWIAAVLALVLYLLMNQSESGRRMYAIGGNREASLLAGLKVSRLRLIGFAIAGICAAIAGILLGATSVSYYPNAGPGLLLPAFAAAFLGSAASKGLRFTVLGTILGVLFLGVIQSGLTLMNVESWVTNVVQGMVLIGAIGLARLQRTH
jgi:ribose transport system permease protein